MKRQITSACLWSLVLFLLPQITMGQLTRPSSQVPNQQQSHYLQFIINQRTVISHSFVEVNFDALDYNSFNLNLPDGRTVNISRTFFQKKTENNWEYHGHQNGVNEHSFIAVRKGENMRAMFSLRGVSYGIHPIGEGLHIFTVENPNNYPDEHHDDDWHKVSQEQIDQSDMAPRYDPVPVGQTHSSARSSAAANECALRVLVAYTTNVSDAMVDPSLEIEAANANYNLANSNSNVTHRVELARIVEVRYDTAGQTFSSTLADFEGTTDGNMDNIHDLRSLYDADMCQLITAALPGACGLASGLGSSYSTAFCVSNVGCITDNKTYAHEFAHLFGCDHDLYVASGSPFDYGHGYVDFPNQWRTIMAYNDQCDDLGAGTPDTVCTRLTYWSNPAVDYFGDPMGVVGDSDNESVLDLEDGTMLAFEATILNKSVYASDNIEAYEDGWFFGESTLTKPSYSTLTVDSRGNLLMQASDRITIEPGFAARSGSSGRMYLTPPCVGISDPPSREAEEDVIAANAEISNLKLSPNPVFDQTTISWTYTSEAETQIVLFSPSGEVLRAIDAGSSSSGQMAIDVAGLSAGLYIVQVQHGNNAETLRLIKMSGN
jgi:hypothetical protein